MKKIALYSIIAVLSVVALTLSCVAMGVSINLFGDSVPSDAEVSKIFFLHRAVFQQLEHLVEIDVAKKQFYPSQCVRGGISKLRCDQYNKLVQGIGVPKAILSIQYDGSLNFQLAGAGSQTSLGWSKGIIYIPGDVSRYGVVVTNVDGAARLPPDIYLRKLYKKWYIFYQKDQN